MTTSSTIGLMPRLLPVTGTFLLPFALVNIALQAQCVAARLNTKVFLGRSDPSVKDGLTDPVAQATSAHSNFLENVPLGLISAALIELNGGNKMTLTYALATLLVARVSHATGIFNPYSGLKFRQAGFYITTPLLVGMSGWAAYLTKSYWGF